MFFHGVGHLTSSLIDGQIREGFSNKNEHETIDCNGIQFCVLQIAVATGDSRHRGATCRARHGMQKTGRAWASLACADCAGGVSGIGGIGYS